MEMVERVARALAAEMGTTWGGPNGEDDPSFLPYKARYMAVARAAIGAMREPDHDMTGNVLRPGEDRTFLVELWQRMIDGALEQSAPKPALSTPPETDNEQQ